MELKNFFEVELNQRLRENPSLFEGSDSCLQLSIDDYICHLDLTQERQIKAGSHPQPDCQIEMSRTIFDQLLAGRLNIPLALISRKIKLKGDILLLNKLKELFN